MKISKVISRWTKNTYILKSDSVPLENDFFLLIKSIKTVGFMILSFYLIFWGEFAKRLFLKSIQAKTHMTTQHTQPSNQRKWVSL